MALALVVGCAALVWDDVRLAKSLAEFDAVYCVKQAGIHWPDRFDVWASLHPEFMDQYEAERRELGFPGGYKIVAPLSCEVGEHGAKGNVARRVSYRYPGMNASASSGIYAAKVALDDGFKVVLAGIPMDADAGHFLPGTKNVAGARRGARWLQRDSFMSGFEKSVPHMQGRVKSVSGYTSEVFGFPTAEWLEAKS